tara:strand:+ start:7531 stop:7695 length:165 start_codon:yes stop_codon:yes gene_type:complete
MIEASCCEKIKIIFCSSWKKYRGDVSTGTGHKKKFICFPYRDFGGDYLGQSKKK